MEIIISAWFSQVALSSFATYVLSDETHELDAEKAFVALSLFNILRFPLSMGPMLITNMVQVMRAVVRYYKSLSRLQFAHCLLILQASVSLKRLNKFMNHEDLDPHAVDHDPKEGK